MKYHCALHIWFMHFGGKLGSKENEMTDHSYYLFYKSDFAETSCLLSVCFETYCPDVSDLSISITFCDPSLVTTTLQSQAKSALIIVPSLQGIDSYVSIIFIWLSRPVSQQSLFFSAYTRLQKKFSYLTLSQRYIVSAVPE